MARPRTTSGYPQVFFDIVEKVSSGTKPLELKCDNNRSAQAQRFRFYDFLKACRNSSDETDLEYGRMGSALLFRVTDNILTIQPRDQTIEAEGLEIALKEWDDSEPTPAAEPIKLTAPPITPVVPSDTHEELIEGFLKED